VVKVGSKTGAVKSPLGGGAGTKTGLTCKVVGRLVPEDGATVVGLNLGEASWAIRPAGVTPAEPTAGRAGSGESRGPVRKPPGGGGTAGAKSAGMAAAVGGLAAKPDMELGKEARLLGWCRNVGVGEGPRDEPLSGKAYWANRWASAEGEFNGVPVGGGREGRGGGVTGVGVCSRFSRSWRRVSGAVPPDWSSIEKSGSSPRGPSTIYRIQGR
jgi:hypothetical protein